MIDPFGLLLAIFVVTVIFCVIITVELEKREASTLKVDNSQKELKE